MGEFQRINVTQDMIESAPDRPSVSRGRTKGTPMDRDVRAWYNEENEPFGGAFTNSQYGSLQTAIVRIENASADKPRKSEYLATLARLGLAETFLGQSGQGTERVQTLAIVKVDEESVSA